MTRTRPRKPRPNPRTRKRQRQRPRTTSSYHFHYFFEENPRADQDLDRLLDQLSFLNLEKLLKLVERENILHLFPKLLDAFS